MKKEVLELLEQLCDGNLEFKSQFENMNKRFDNIENDLKEVKLDVEEVKEKLERLIERKTKRLKD